MLLSFFVVVLSFFVVVVVTVISDFFTEMGEMDLDLIAIDGLKPDASLFSPDADLGRLPRRDSPYNNNNNIMR